MINFQLPRKLFKWEILIEKIHKHLKASLSLVTVVVVVLFVCDDVRKQEIKYNKMPL